MSGWQAGDLAVCVDATPLSTAPWGSLSVGQVGRVLLVSARPEGLTLVVEGALSGHPSGAYRAVHFRKILPDKHEACETEFVTLLKRSKRTVGA